MKRLDLLEADVCKLYKQKKFNKNWRDWIYKNHVLVTANFATDLASKYKANVELSRVAALLHDITDVIMERKEENHFKESLLLAQKIMKQYQYSNNDIDLIVDDALRYHSCHGNEKPKSLEGKILATADSLAHLKTDFYIYFTRAFKDEMSYESTKQKVLEKLDRDINKKIFFEEERSDAMKDYKALKSLFLK